MRRVITAASLAVAACFYLTAPASAAEYVAIGDSYQSGEGAGNYLPSTDTAANNCHRSRDAAVALVAKRYASFSFNACSGAKASEVVKSRLVRRDGGIQMEADGRAVTGMNGLDRGTKLVTIGLGGNDLGFAPLIEECVKGRLPFAEACSIKGSPAYRQAEASLASLNSGVPLRVVIPGVTPAATGSIRSDIETVIKRVKAKAPTSRILLVGAPQIFEPGATCTSLLDNTDMQWLGSLTRRANTGFAAIARRNNITYVDVENTFTGHGFCASDSWVRPLAAGVPEAMHPTAAGQAAIATRIASTLDGGAR